MPRIVKAGAETVHFSENENWFDWDAINTKDTFEIKNGWRPENYKNPHYKSKKIMGTLSEEEYVQYLEHIAFEAGFEACLEALGELK